MTWTEPSSLHLSCSQWSCWLVSAFIVFFTVAFCFHLSLCGSERPPGIQIFLMRERMPLGKGPKFKLGLCFVSIEIWALTWIISTWDLYWFTEQSFIGKEKRLHLKEVSDPERKGERLGTWFWVCVPSSLVTSHCCRHASLTGLFCPVLAEHCELWAWTQLCYWCLGFQSCCWAISA